MAIRSSVRRAVFLSLAFILGELPCGAQCARWDERFWRRGVTYEVTCSLVHDDGSGPALYLGGRFSHAASSKAANVVEWDGSTWSALGTGTNGVVRAMAVYDDGSGPALYVGGTFTTAGGVAANRIAKWDGADWSALGAGVTGSGASVEALAAYDDGSGPALYVGGVFTMAGSVATQHVARWNGTSWSALSTGVGAGGVYAVAVHDAGAGPSLFIGGTFDAVGGIAANRVARWDGASWSALASGITGSATVFALTSFDDGSGAALYAGGQFATAGGVLAKNVAKWDGTNWTALGSGVELGMGVRALVAFDDGAGPALHAGGQLAATSNHVYRWDGSGWSVLGSGFTTNSGPTRVDALTVFDDGSGAALYVGGDFMTAGGLATPGIARWRTSAWSALDVQGMGVGVFADAYPPFAKAFGVHDDGTGPALYVGGSFRDAGDVTATRIARWDGASWSALGTGFSDIVLAIESFDDGSGGALYAGGAVTSVSSTTRGIAKWDGSAWIPLGTAVDPGGGVYDLIVHDDGSGPALFAGGGFTSIDGVSADGIARWNGSSWSALGPFSGAANQVEAMAIYDDGGGPALYAGGLFYSIAGASNVGIAKWDGASWSTLSGALNGWVTALAVYDDGGGPALYAAGNFTTAGGMTANRVAKWNGASWSTLDGGAGVGVNDTVYSLAVFDDGSGPALYLGGRFTIAGGAAARHLARWNGSTWAEVGGGVGDSIDELAVFDDGADGAPDLYLAGFFTWVGDTASVGIAQWHGCSPGDAYCFGDGIDPVVTAPCPCGNFGDAGRGCANSNAALGGARLFASGTPSPNTLLFTCDGLPNNTFATFLRSSATDDSGFVFGDGIRCLNGTGLRFGAQNAGQGGHPPNTVSSGAASVPSGNTRYYQLHYRNPSAGFCPPATFNISNGYRVVW